MKRLLIVATATAALAVPAASTSAAVPPPGPPSPVFFCGKTVEECVQWVKDHIAFTCHDPFCPPDPPDPTRAPRD